MTLLAQLGAESAILMKFAVLVTVANDQAADLILQRQPSEQLRLAADFEAEVVRLARIEDFFDHFAELIHFDGEDAAIFSLITVLRDGVAKGEVDRFYAVAQNILKTDEQREFQPARLGLFDHVREVYRRAGIPATASRRRVRHR